MSFRWVILCLMFLPISTLGQTMVEYSPDFKFKDGLYITFDDFKNNNPIPITHIISNYDIRDADYLEQVLQDDSVVYYDNLFEERAVAVERLWGFCQKNRVFIGFGAGRSYNNPEFFDFFPLINIGAISFFTAVESYYTTMDASPSMGIGFNDPMMNNNVTVTQSEQVQLLLHFKTGKVLLGKRGDLGGLPTDLVSDLIRSDIVLLTEFQSLSTKDQKQKGMFFIRKLNQRNPISFPVD